MVSASEISLVIPVYGNKELLKKLLASLHPDHPRIIVSDNSIETVDQVIRWSGHYSDLFVQLYENRGDAWAKDVGLFNVKTSYVCFIDSDTRALTADWWEWMVKDLADFCINGVGAVGAKLLYTNGNIQHAGVSVKNGIPSHDYEGMEAWYEPANQPRIVDAVTGSVMMMQTWVAKQFQFSTGYRHGYFTDIDLCMRLRRAGYNIFYQPQAVFEHVTGASYALIDRKQRQEWLDYNLKLFKERWGNDN